jgi:predicted enzyme related to lactoylglutathione lyase
MPTIALVVPILPVRDLARAMDFYWRLGFSAHSWQNGDSYAFIQRDGHEIHLTRSDKLTGNESPSGAYFYLVKGTAAALEAEFRATGVEILTPLAPRPWKMNEFSLSDPDGNMLHFGDDIS